MRIIKMMCEQAKEEAETACEYAKYAIEFKLTKPTVSDMYSKFASAELSHAKTLYDNMQQAVKDANASGKEVPAYMSKKYELYNKEILDLMAKARTFIELYK